MIHGIVQLAYIIATGLFVFALHWMNAPATARRGVYAGVVGMTLAVVATWAQPEVVHHLWIVIAVVAGFAVGIPLSRVPLTAVPQRTALSHAFGAFAAALAPAAALIRVRVAASIAVLTLDSRLQQVAKDAYADLPEASAVALRNKLGTLVPAWAAYMTLTAVSG